MSGSADAAWDALREAIRGAMRDAFANVGEAELGPRLLVLFDVCLEHAAPTRELRLYREGLDNFGQLGRQDRSVLVARGLRLCASHRQPVVEKPVPKRRKTHEPELRPTLPKLRGAKAKKTASVPAQVVAETESADPKPGTKTTRRKVVSAKPKAEQPEVPGPPGIEELKGVGKATAEKLRARGLSTIVDLAFVLPAAYEDRRVRKPLCDLEDGELAVIEGTVGSIRQGFSKGRFLASVEIHVLTMDDAPTQTVVARWFHRVGGLNNWSKGGPVLAIGTVREYKGQWTMAHPELRDPDDPGPAIGVRYPAVEGVAPRTFAKVVRLAAGRLADPDVGFVDALPAEICEAQALPGQLEALQNLHMPDEAAEPEVVDALCRGASPSHRRLAFDEFFFFQLALLRERGSWQAVPSRVHPTEDGFDKERLRACFPFELTGAQWRVLGEIERDVRLGPPMLRLLQGDVGSGKTAVAFAAAVAIAGVGAQTAIMAPTEILAEQHLRTFSVWCESAGLKVALLTGGTPKAARKSLLALLQAGRINILVGTHALLTDDVVFAELGLVVVDEQHRFGVQQRAILRRKGDVPHLLVMTATPIPRTMALCAYGQLEVSVIDEMPPGREPVVTKLFTGKRGLDTTRRNLAKAVNKGHRAFVVCPLVEASEALEVTDVEATAAVLRTLLPKHTVSVIHGRMSSKDKDAIMSAFRAGESDVLVATTVIEVGVDVPDATVMVIEHAERFGLAQLHQLRGRVGRGGGAAWCLLHTGQGKASEVAARLGILTETGDGFVVAERDLALRGPGEVFGTRQAGAPRLRYAGFAGEGTKMLVAAREAARGLLAQDPELEQHPEVVAELARRRSEDAAITADAG